MNQADRVGIGLVGVGFLAETRVRCYGQAAHGELVAVCSRRPDRSSAFARRHGIANSYATLDELLKDPRVQMVDLCVPNHLHRPLAEQAARAGRHVVCTKPLTAYVGQDLPDDAPDEAVSGRDRAQMRALATEDADAMVRAADRAGVQLMYGENWVYAPSVGRAADLIASSDGAILEMHGNESHSGSHSPYSKLWRHTGGGALLRLGSHPVGAMLYLKRCEGDRRDGQPIRPVQVTAEVADLSLAGEASGRMHLETGWVDVENWGCVTIGFSDGTRGVAWGSDNMLGGMESRLEVLGSNCRFRCNLSPHDLLEAYAPTEEAFQNQYLMEKLSSKSGWSTPLPDEDWSSGHLAMCTDFVEAVRGGRPALSTGELGADVVKVIYGAYESAARGCRVMF